MSRASYTTRTFGLPPQDFLGPALLQARRRQWQQELPKRLLDEIRFHLLETVPAETLHPLAESAGRERVIRRAIRGWLERNQLALLSQGGEGLVAYLYGEVAGFGPLQPFLDDLEVTEIKLIDPRTVLLERAGRRLCRPVEFSGGVDEVRHLAVRLAELGGKPASRREPASQVQMADGSRILLMPFEEVPQILVRRRPVHVLTPDLLLTYGTLDEAMLSYLHALAQAQAFFLIAGPSGAGKTAFLEMLLSLFPPQAHLVVVQQGAEIRRDGVHPLLTLLEGSDDPASPNSLETVAMRTLKMGAISLVIGETKGAEAAAILHGISAGVRGGGTTIHTDDAEEALRRLARLARSSRFTDLFAGATAEELRGAVARSVHVVVQLEQAPSTGRRYVRQIAEVEIAPDGWELRPIFVGRLQMTADGDEAIWERVGEAGQRVQALLASHCDIKKDGPMSLAGEREAELGRLLSNAAALARSGEWDEAAAALEQVLTQAPESTEAVRLLERVRAGQADDYRLREVAVEQLRQEGRRALEAGDLSGLEKAATEAARQHLDDLAAELEEWLSVVWEEALPASELFCLALEKLGRDNSRAAQLLRTVLRKEPGYPEAEFYLGLTEK